MSDSSQPRVSATVAATVKVEPIASQGVLVLGMCVSALTLVCATVLLMTDKVAGWAFLVVSTVMFIGTLIAWRKAQSDTDMAGSHPTTIVKSDGTSFSTDTRAMLNPEAMQGVMQLFQMRPLPEPDGVLDAGGEVVPGSQIQAAELVNQINESVQVTATQLSNALMQTETLSFSPPVSIPPSAPTPTEPAQNDTPGNQTANG